MSSATLGPKRLPSVEEMQGLRSSWGWFLALGALMVVMGTFAISWACIVTITELAVMFFGFMLLAGGFAEIIGAFSAAKWGGTLFHVLIGVLYVVAGFVLIDQPAISAIQLTLVAAIFLMVGGVFRIISALADRFPGWGWVLLNGVVTLMLGILIYKGWPETGLWAIGLFIGIEMIFNGWAWIMLAFALKSLPKNPVLAS